MAADGSYIIKTKLDTAGIDEGLKTAEGSFDSFATHAKKIGAIVGGALAADSFVEIGKKALSYASDLQEVQNVVDVTFTSMSGAVNQYAKDARKSAGLSETMAKQYMGTFGTMAKSFGFTEEEAYDMSAALTQLTGDVASFYNIGQEEAFNKLTAVFTGETEALKVLGVVMTQTNLDAYALSKGIEKSTKDMSSQELVALRLSFIFDQLSSAQGDYVRTSDSWANQTKDFSLQVENLMATVGTGLVTLLTPALQTLNDTVMPALISGAESVAEALTKVSTWISENQSLIEGVTTAVIAFGAAWAAIDLATWVINSGGVLTLFKNLASAVYGATAAKIADKAVDLQLIALYTVDYIKALGAVIAKLGASAAAWSAKTAATVASTAAEWAHIAATTAWNAICTVATTVTSAFGAAIAFLTSPIGFVVVAITALIAVIALLVKNWDKVKETAQKVWSGIKEAWGGAASWFGGIWDSIVENTGKAWNKIKDTISSAIERIQGWINGLTGKSVAANVVMSSNAGGAVSTSGGGNSGGYSVSSYSVNTASIPYLASGAVIPPNAPFAAVLGDQRNGTNLEAPESLIRDIFREEMADMIGGMMAGFEAMVAEQQATRSAIEDIQIGDTTIGRAAARYERRQNLVRGGSV